MKRVAVFIIFCVILSSSAGATDPDTWNGWLFAGEGVAGAGLGAGLMAAAAQSDEDKDRPDWAAISGWVAGNAAGVILVGELFDGRSANWYVTYPVTLVAASIIPVTAGVIAERRDVDFGEALFTGMVIAFGTPVVAAFTYNLVKEPVDETWTVRRDVDVQPYAGLLADNGDGYVPVYGLSASF
jgi:hypothetical protein